MAPKICIEPSACFTTVLALLLLPYRWWMAAVLAALVHELAHLAVLCLLGGQVMGVKIGPSGAKIDAGIMERGREVLCALAGPLGSFSLLLITQYYPETALCGLIQGGYNLLPIYPLDGGRVLRCILPDAVCAAAEGFTIVLLWGLGFWVVCKYDLDIFFLFPAITATTLVIRRKTPCKESRFAVQ